MSNPHDNFKMQDNIYSYTFYFYGQFSANNEYQALKTNPLRELCQNPQHLQFIQSLNFEGIEFAK